MDKGNYKGLPYLCHFYLGAVGLNKVLNKGERLLYEYDYCKKRIRET